MGDSLTLPVILAQAGISAYILPTKIRTEAVVLLVECACFPQQSYGVCIPKQELGNEGNGGWIARLVYRRQVSRVGLTDGDA